MRVKTGCVSSELRRNPFTNSIYRVRKQKENKQKPELGEIILTKNDLALFTRILAKDSK